MKLLRLLSFIFCFYIGNTLAANESMPLDSTLPPSETALAANETPPLSSTNDAFSNNISPGTPASPARTPSPRNTVPTIPNTPPAPPTPNDLPTPATPAPRVAEPPANITTPAQGVAPTGPTSNHTVKLRQRNMSSMNKYIIPTQNDIDNELSP